MANNGVGVGNNIVSVIDTSDNSVSAISVGREPLNLAMSQDGTRVYVTNHKGHSISPQQAYQPFGIAVPG